MSKSIELVMPHSVEMEKLILGAIMKEETAIHRVAGFLKPDSFYMPGHQLTYQCIMELFAGELAINTITVWEFLKKRKDYDLSAWDLNPSYLTRLTKMVTNTTKLEQQIRYVEQQAIARRKILINDKETARLYRGEDDIMEIIAEADNEAYLAKNSVTNHTAIDAESGGDELLEHVERAMLKEGLTGFDYGINPINELTGGSHRGQLTVIASRPAHGKSAIASFFQYSHAKTGIPSLFLSMEMTRVECYARMASIKLREMDHYIPYEDIMFGNLDQKDLSAVKHAINAVKAMPLIIDATPNLSSIDVKAKFLKARNDYGVESVFIDYIQLAKLGLKNNNNRAQGISDYMTDLKTMCKSFMIPINLLSQVDRSVGKFGQIREANMADLKDSGGLEEKADNIFLLHRPDAVATAEDPVMEGDEGILIVNCAKRKMGRTGRMRIDFDMATNFPALHPDLTRESSFFPGSSFPSNVHRSLEDGRINAVPNEDEPPF